MDSAEDILYAMIKDTPLYDPISSMHHLYLRLKYSKGLYPSGPYHIKPSKSIVPAFYLDLPHVYSDMMRGTYESDIIDTLVELSTNESIFWEVGAQWGYFTFALAPLVKEVTAFEMNTNNIRRLERAKELNGADNVNIVNGTVGESISLSEFETPDVALIDIEGWEYRILKDEIDFIKNIQSFVLEVHDLTQSGGPEIPPVYEEVPQPDEIPRLLVENGFSVQQLGQATKTTHHLLVER